MNILFHTFWYPYNEGLLGIFIREHAESCQMAGGNVAVQAIIVKRGRHLFKTKCVFKHDEGGVPTYYFVVKSCLWKYISVATPLLYMFAKWHYKKVIAKKFKADIIVSNVIQPAGITGFWLANKLKKPHVLIEHWTQLPRFMKHNIFASLAKKSLRKSALILPVSNYLKKQLIEYGAKPERTVVVPNVIATNEFYYGVKQPKDHFRFLAVMSLNYPKDPFLLINALGIISKKSNKRVVLGIAGQGPYLSELKKLAAGFDNLTVNFWGLIPKMQLAEEMHLADYVVHASYIETFSLVVAEAICTGTPICASDISPINDLIIDGQNGLLCNNTIEDWVVGIEKLMQGNYQSPEESQRFLQRFSKEAVGKQLLAELKKIATA